MIYLLKLTHNKTGLHYLCKFDDKRKDHTFDTYPGSGTEWKRHLKQHGVDLSREVLGIFENIDDFKSISIPFSKDNNIVLSEEWANLRYEEGNGGDTKSGLKAYNNSNRTAFFEEGKQPKGWVRGRHDKWNFTQEVQKQKSSKRIKTAVSEETKRKISIANTGKPGLVGDANPSKRLDVRLKISKATSIACQTPLGVFESMLSAAEAHGCSVSNISSKIKRGVEGYFKC